MDTEKKENVYHVANRIISILEKQEQGRRRNAALLAAFRNSAGKELSEADEVWPFLFENLPEKYLSTTGRATYEENAIFFTVQLYAVCRQGSSQNVKADNTFAGSMGQSLRAGRGADTEKAMDRRFNAMITSDTFDEFTYYLRQLVKQVRSKETMTINFPRLADDLYWFQKGKRRSISFRWATEYYYRQYMDNEKDQEVNNNE